MALMFSSKLVYPQIGTIDANRPPNWTAGYGYQSSHFKTALPVKHLMYPILAMLKLLQDAQKNLVEPFYKWLKPYFLMASC